MVVEKPDDSLCHLPWFRLSVCSDGLVHVCCYNTKELGHVPEQSLQEIWEGELYNRLRQSIIDRAFDQGCTEACPIVSGRGIQKPSEGTGGLQYERKVRDANA